VLTALSPEGRWPRCLSPEKPLVVSGDVGEPDGVSVARGIDCTNGHFG